jgi:MFS family permease
MIERIFSGALTTMSGSTICSATLSDLTAGKGLAVTGAGLGSYAGLGCIIGPLLGGQLIARTGNLRLPFILASIVALFQMAMILTSFEETIGERQHKHPLESA